MLVYLNREPVAGPWGGGNKTVDLLSKEIIKRGHNLVYDLNHENIDVMFCIDPRPNKNGEWYQHILNYKACNPQAKIVQRVGDVGGHGKPDLTELTKQSVNFSDSVVYISQWALDQIGQKKSENIKVDNLGPLSIFHKFKRENKIKDQVRICTHHWSNNEKKGFDIYEYIDRVLMPQNERLKFTYIGRVPEGFRFHNVNYIPPCDVDALVNILPDHDFYITASRDETGGNHVVEALGCGLPVIFHQAGGGIVDYCSDYGLGYSSKEELLPVINKMIDEYDNYKKKVMSYTKTLEDSVSLYVQMIEGA